MNQAKMSQQVGLKIEKLEETQKRTQADQVDPSSSSATLQQLIQLLTLNVKTEGACKEEGRLVVDFSKNIPDFDEEQIPVEKWFRNFELNADAYGLIQKQKYVQARTKVTKTAALFLESTEVYEYEALRDELIRKLCIRIKKNDESFHKYVLQMKRIAARGEMDTVSVIRYVVNGLDFKTDFKYNLYRCTSFKELR